MVAVFRGIYTHIGLVGLALIVLFLSSTGCPPVENDSVKAFVARAFTISCDGCNLHVRPYTIQTPNNPDMDNPPPGPDSPNEGESATDVIDHHGEGEYDTPGPEGEEQDGIDDAEVPCADDNSEYPEVDDQGNEIAEGILALEQDLHLLINRQRLEMGLSQLQPLRCLNAVARSFSQEMIDKGFFGHFSPSGENLRGRLGRAGIPFRAASENLARSLNITPPAEAVLNVWLDSQTHVANLINPLYTHTGIGIAQAKDGMYYYTQIYICFK